METAREEWLQARKGGIGGSDIAAICGVNPYAGPLDVYLDKLGLIAPKAENAAMRLGTKLEPVLADLYSEETGKSLILSPLVRHHKKTWALGTPDRLIVNELRGVELKTAGLRSAHLWGEEEDAIPPHYMVQCQWYMAVTGFPDWDVAVLIGGQDFHIYHLTGDAELQAQLFDIGGRFWRDHVLAQSLPALDASESWDTYLSAKYARHSDALLSASEEAERWARELQDAVRILKQAKERKETAENHIKDSIGDNAGIIGKSWKATWKKTKGRSIVDWGAFADACHQPALLAAHTTTQEGERRFLFKAKE